MISASGSWTYGSWMTVSCANTHSAIVESDRHSRSDIPGPAIQIEVHVQSKLSYRGTPSIRIYVCSKADALSPQAPEVVFVRDETHPIPIHPHIYSNGIICLDLLDRQGWSPVHNVESVCVSLQSMLTSNTKNERPPGDESFVRHNTQRPRDISFVFHDNEV